jgi:tRNA modification GTPase
MSETTVTVLTPPGSSALAVLAVRGPGAWPALQRLFRTTAGKQLSGPPAGFVFGRIGGPTSDEVILTAIGPDTFEVHCHGGPRVVAWLVDLLRSNGIKEAPPQVGESAAAQAARLLSMARTVRTAGILLDQLHGAYDRAEEAVRRGRSEAAAVQAILRRNVAVGRHLIDPWRVVVAGAPNAGKSTLLNSLAGFARSVVSPIPGTTRDAVSVSLAFDGWPVDLTDTAGFREPADALESEGVERARAAAAQSDLVLWVVDATGRRPASVGEVANELGLSESRMLVVFNKTDVVGVSPSELPEAVRVSALTGVGLTDLVSRIVKSLVPNLPAPGEPVPFTPEQCDRWTSD